MRPSSPLPIDAILPEILDSLTRCPNLVIEAPPGAGKTTRVPAALLRVLKGDVVVLEPRRIAARMAARRVAWEMGEEAGQTVGYQVRFEEVAGPRTRLRFVTEGVLTRRLLSDPGLKGVAAVVLDEFHERHLESDLALALLKRLQGTRPELRVVVMSATLDAAPIARYLDDCPILRSEGRQFPLCVQHLAPSSKPLERQVADALEQLIAAESSGDMLVFLPGAAEIRRAMRESQGMASRAGLVVLPLYGDLSPAEQDRAVTPATQRKVIMATNVAESSVTVEGITAVIDSGLARAASYSHWTGLPTLQVGRISQASAAQRAGRAGRTGPGQVIRLYPIEDFLLRPKHDEPEILRGELSQLCLALRAMGIAAPAGIAWLDAPPGAAVESAELLLDRLGAQGSMVQQLAKFPLHPRLARILIAALQRGVGEDGCMAAALLGSGARFETNDLLAAMDADVDYQTRQQVAQLRRMARPQRQSSHDDDALLMAVLSGFPDRVARRRLDNQVLLSTGTSAEVAGETLRYEFMVAIDAEDRKDKPLPLVRLTARIEPEWLIELFPESIREESGVEWNRSNERVEAVSALLYDGLVIQESRGAMPEAEAAADLLARKALEAGLDRFVDRDALGEFLARSEFAGMAAPDVPGALCDLCAGLRSFAELKAAAAHLVPLLEQKIGGRRLNEMAPSRIRLRRGERRRFITRRASRPGLHRGFRIFSGCGDATDRREGTPVVVHLLAPNQRAVQPRPTSRGFGNGCIRKCGGN